MGLGVSGNHNISTVADEDLVSAEDSVYTPSTPAHDSSTDLEYYMAYVTNPSLCCTGMGEDHSFVGQHNPNPAYKAGKLPLRMVTDSVVLAPLQG